MSGWLLIPAVWLAGAAATWVGLYRYWMGEFPDDHDAFMDWIGACIWASFGAIIWPVFAIGYGVYRLNHRTAA